jgi:hypothetical protein
MLLKIVIQKVSINNEINKLLFILYIVLNYIYTGAQTLNDMSHSFTVDNMKKIETIDESIPN